jgi:hypothetical protein
MSFAVFLGSYAVQAVAQDDASDVNPTFHLVQGRGIAVCDAFAQRLKVTEFKRPIYCDIPENDSVAGFAKLKRVPLPVEKGAPSFSRVYEFGRIQNQFVDMPEHRLEDVKVLYPAFVRAWTYDPDVSLNNDGVTEHLLFWQGAGALGGDPPANCGERGLGDNQELIHASPTGLILTSDDKQIDEQKTREFLQHPKPTVPPWPFFAARGV